MGAELLVAATEPAVECAEAGTLPVAATELLKAEAEVPVEELEPVKTVEEKVSVPTSEPVAEMPVEELETVRVEGEMPVAASEPVKAVDAEAPLAATEPVLEVAQKGKAEVPLAEVVAAGEPVQSGTEVPVVAPEPVAEVAKEEKVSVAESEPVTEVPVARTEPVEVAKDIQESIAASEPVVALDQVPVETSENVKAINEATAAAAVGDVKDEASLPVTDTAKEEKASNVSIKPWWEENKEIDSAIKEPEAPKRSFFQSIMQFFKKEEKVSVAPIEPVIQSTQQENVSVEASESLKAVDEVPVVASEPVKKDTMSVDVSEPVKAVVEVPIAASEPVKIVDEIPLVATEPVEDIAKESKVSV